MCIQESYNLVTTWTIRICEILNRLWRTWPLTCFAPNSLALIRPDLFGILKTWTGTGSVLQYSSSWEPRCSKIETNNYRFISKQYKFIILPRSLLSSTRMISSRSALGDLLITLHTVLNSVVHASLWNTITTLVVGNLSGYALSLHLQEIHYGYKKPPYFFSIADNIPTQSHISQGSVKRNQIRSN